MSKKASVKKWNAKRKDKIGQAAQRVGYGNTFTPLVNRILAAEDGEEIVLTVKVKKGED